MSIMVRSGIGAALAVALLSGCGSSTTPTQPPSTHPTSTHSPPSAPPHPTSTGAAHTPTVAPGGPISPSKTTPLDLPSVHLSGNFCTDLNSIGLLTTTHTSRPQAEHRTAVWDGLVHEAPAELRQSVASVDAFLRSVLENRADVQAAAALATANRMIIDYVATHC